MDCDLTPELLDRVVAGVAAGLSDSRISQACGLKRMVLHRWAHKGRHTWSPESYRRIFEARQAARQRLEVAERLIARGDSGAV